VKFFHDSWNFWAGAGWFAVPLLFLAFFCWFRLISLSFLLKNKSFKMTYYESAISHRLIEGQSTESIRDWLSSEPGVISRIVNYSFNQAENLDLVLTRYLEASECELEHIGREFGLLSALVKSAPLIGLLGTVVGMVETFYGLSHGVNMALISAGISKALLTTQLGLLVALPGVFGLSFIRRKFSRYQTEMERLQFHIKALFCGGTL
jgi:biopolymer transport protein ExbB